MLNWAGTMESNLDRNPDPAHPGARAPRRRGGRPGPGRLALSAVLAGCLAAAACSSSSRKVVRAAPTTSSSSSSSTSAVPAAPVYPLTGLPVDNPGHASRPALVVKIENEPPARPQSGLQAADVVYEEIIEGGDTRFVAVFQSTDADPVGSIRSVRPTDPPLVRPIGGLFAYSGGTAKFVNLLHATSMIDVGESADPGAYFLRREKPSDHKLFSSTARLYAFPGAAGAKPPPPLFPFLPPGQPFAPAGAQPASHLETVVGTQHVFYDWDPAAGWRRAINGQPHVVEGGGQLIATNVVVQFVPWVPSPGDFDTLHSPVLVAQVVGSGDAWILAGGKVVKGHWSKPTPDAVISYTGSDGQPVSFLPGRTWVELAGTGTPTVLR